jgi:hypothetical protein
MEDKKEKIDEKVAGNLFQNINSVISELEEDENLKKEASILHSVFMKIAKIPKEKATGHKSAPKGYPEKSKMYADPVNFKYPIDSEEHARAAWSYIHQSRNRKGYSKEELKSMENRIRKALDKYGVDIEEEKDAHD